MNRVETENDPISWQTQSWNPCHSLVIYTDIIR